MLVSRSHIWIQCIAAPGKETAALVAYCDSSSRIVSDIWESSGGNDMVGSRG